MAPLIFISTVLTHLFGGSAGREGAALQMGGSLGCTIGRIFKVNNESMKILIMCGMSAVFTALFSTPITATVFSIEVISVGVFYHSALVPCLISSISAYFVTTLFSIPKLNFSFLNIPEFSIELVFPIIILAIACGICSIIFCTAIKTTSVLNAKLFKNNYIKIIVGGFIIIVLTLLVNTTDYNGAGMDIIFKAVNGYAKPEAFALKILFTAITIGVGFKGGEIVPTLFVGATFGNIIGGLIGLPPGFSAALGMISVFCGVVNCPIASLILSIELFGSSGILFFAVSICISYVFSGYYSLYSSQKIVYSKLSLKYINKNTI
ncbi:MAG: chloride channel protein, partial [Oscillospiraceae bacterium]